jgi:D-alanine transaminase
MSHFAYVNGRYEPQQNAQVHIEDRGYQFADGVYEVICVWDGRPVDYAAHLARLTRSLEALKISAPMSWRALTVINREIVWRNRLTRGIIYIQINRGVAPRAHPFPPAVRPSVIVTAKQFSGPSEAAARKGAKVVTAPDIRWGRRDIKSVALLPNILAKQRAAEAKAFEAVLLTPDNIVTEASASNAWIVARNKTIVTHPATEVILGGVTRATMIKVARAAGYKVEERAFTLKEMLAAKEVFLTGTTTFVMPVVQIDQSIVANGKPGEFALDLRRRYMQYMCGIHPNKAWDV